MLSEAVKSSNIIETIAEESAEDSSSHKLLFRVLNKKRWSKLLVSIIKLAQEEEDFGISVRKEYFFDEAPTFVWVLLVWGDLDSAVDFLGPHLSKRAGPPKPPPSVSVVSAPRNRTELRTADDGSRYEVTTVPLPFRKANRNTRSPDEVRRWGAPTRGLGATVGAPTIAGGR